MNNMESAVNPKTKGVRRKKNVRKATDAHGVVYKAGVILVVLPLSLLFLSACGIGPCATVSQDLEGNGGGSRCFVAYSRFFCGYTSEWKNAKRREGRRRYGEMPLMESKEWDALTLNAAASSCRRASTNPAPGDSKWKRKKRYVQGVAWHSYFFLFFMRFI